MPKQVRPIVIFDSGVGGLSIYQEIKQTMPGLDVIYCSDTAAFPYGAKSEEAVIERTSYCLGELARQYKPSLAVIACNTASTISLPRVRKELSFPVVGVVPAIKTASEHSVKRIIGLLATPGTVERDYTDQLIEDFASDCQVIRVGSGELVHLAEQYLRGQAIQPETLKAVVEPFFRNGQSPDAIVLGCTHFPLLKDALDAVVPESVQWLDSGAAIARRVSFLLGGDSVSEAGKDIFVYTGESESIHSLIPALLGMGFSDPVILK